MSDQPLGTGVSGGADAKTLVATLYKRLAEILKDPNGCLSHGAGWRSLGSHKIREATATLLNLSVKTVQRYANSYKKSVEDEDPSVLEPETRGAKALSVEDAREKWVTLYDKIAARITAAQTSGDVLTIEKLARYLHDAKTFARCTGNFCNASRTECRSRGGCRSWSPVAARSVARRIRCTHSVGGNSAHFARFRCFFAVSGRKSAKIIFHGYIFAVLQSFVRLCAVCLQIMVPLRPIYNGGARLCCLG